VSELDEALMSIVGGVDIRRKQLTFDYVERETGRWERGRTLARIARLIGRLFHIRYTLGGTSYLLHRMGFSVQVPARRAAERNEAAIAMWRTETWAKVRG
jgi:transposase